MSDTPSTPPSGPRNRGRPGNEGSGPRGGKPAAANPAGRDAPAPVASAAELADKPPAAGTASAAALAEGANSSAASASASAGEPAMEGPAAPPRPADPAPARGPEPEAPRVPPAVTTGPAAPASASPASASPASTSPAASVAAPATPAGLNTPAKRFEPAILPIAAALVVLVGAVAFLLSSPRERTAPAAVQQADAVRLASVDQRIAALEARPMAAGLAERAATAERRLEAAETSLRELAARPVADAEARSGLAAAAAALESARAAAAEGQRRLEERLAAGEARDAGAARAAADRVGALEGRAQEEARRSEARLAQAEATLANRLSGAEQALAARVTAAEQAFGPRLAALDAALNGRVEAAGQAMGARMDAAGKALDERLSAAEAGVNERIGRQEAALAERVRQFEARLAGAEAAERRLGVLAARGSLQTALEAGRPLGPALAGLTGTPPVALTRYREAAPPTEAALRLSFEEAARAARLAAEPQGGTVADSALARLQGLVTVRRGEQVVVGDAVSGELERARRSLDAGDLPGAVERLDRLPPPSRAAMAGWIGQARDLVEARAALRDLGTGAN